MAKPEKHRPPDNNEQILHVLVAILGRLRRTNALLINTELNNQQRHQEVLDELQKLTNPDATKITFTKVRREPIPK